MTNWFCKDCPVTGTDCGPWEDSSDFFKNIKSFHKDHIEFQIGEPNFGKLTEIEQAFTDYFNQNIHQWYHTIICEQKGPEKACLIKEKWEWESQT